LAGQIWLEKGEERLKIVYTHHFGLPLDAVWKGIQDEEVLKKAIPGCQAFSQVEENVYHAEMGISVGPDMKLEEEDTGVKLTCTAEVQVTGVLASVGQRVMGGVAKLVIGQFFKTAEKEMGQMFSHS
jgi:hypothetical protein